MQQVLQTYVTCHPIPNNISCLIFIFSSYLPGLSMYVLSQFTLSPLFTEYPPLFPAPSNISLFDVSFHQKLQNFPNFPTMPTLPFPNQVLFCLHPELFIFAPTSLHFFNHSCNSVQLPSLCLSVSLAPFLLLNFSTSPRLMKCFTMLNLSVKDYLLCSIILIKLEFYKMH